MHESTVSRVTSNKYIATPRGTFELKYFFTAAIAGANGTAHSAEAVRHRIKLLIAAESGRDVLSDDTIVDLMRKDRQSGVTGKSESVRVDLGGRRAFKKEKK